MEHLDEYNYVKDYKNYHGHRVYIGYKSKHKAYKGYKPKYKAYKGYKGYKSSYKGYKAYPSMRKEYKEGNGMKCGCCSKQFRTSKEERLAFLNCGYYSPSWMVQSNGIEPETLKKWNLDPMDNDHFICFDCQADIEASQSRDYNNSLLSPMEESKRIKEDWDDEFPCEICGKESEDVMQPCEMFEFEDYMDYEDGSMQSKVSKCATKLVSNDTKYTSTMMCPDCFEKLFWNRAKAMCSPRKKAVKPTVDTGVDTKATAPKKARVTPKVKAQICLELYNQLLDVFKEQHGGKDPVDFYIEDSFGKYGGPGSKECNDDYKCNYDWMNLIHNSIRSYTLAGLYPEYKFTDDAREEITTKIYNAAYRDMDPGRWSIRKGAPELIFKRPETEYPIESYFKSCFGLSESVFNDDQIMLADEFLQSTGNYFDVQDKRKSGYSGVVGRIIVVANPSNKSLVKRDAEVFAASKGLEVYSCSDFLEPGKFDIEFAKPGSAKSISDFYSKGCKYESKENKMKERRRIAEDRYNSVEDELRDIEYGGYDEFEMDDEYRDPYLAKAIHKNAQDAGLSDLDYVNREEALESIEDDWAYELETQDYYSDFAEVVNSRTVQELYDEEAAELADEGYYRGPYGSRITNGKDLLAEMMESWARYMEDEIPCPPGGYRYDGVDRIQHMLDAAVKYANNPVTPKVARFYECLVVLAEEYNEVVANVFGNDPEVPTLTIPSNNVNESVMLRKCKALREKLNK